jgi:hypothetical protein
MKGLTIEVGELVSVNLMLHVGEIRTVIEVLLPMEAEQNAESNAIGSVVDSGRVQQLPLNGRTFWIWGCPREAQ